MTQVANFEITEKMLKFFHEETINIIKDSNDIASISPESHFKAIMEKMLNSEDPEIKIGFSRFLMFRGFMFLIEKSTEIMMKQMPDKIFKPV